MTYYKDVMDWIQEYQPELITDNEAREELYKILQLEEIKERKQAEYNRNIVEAYDGICYTVRTSYGMGEKEGFMLYTLFMTNSVRYNTACFKECREEVKRSNRTKSKERREDGKIIKGPNYEAPNLLPIIKKYHDLQNS